MSLRHQINGRRTNLHLSHAFAARRPEAARGQRSCFLTLHMLCTSCGYIPRYYRFSLPPVRVTAFLQPACRTCHAPPTGAANRATALGQLGHRLWVLVLIRFQAFKKDVGLGWELGVVCRESIHVLRVCVASGMWLCDR
jgi:hypothetical protein